jgi:CubicO group peptidase (beta-lactamase class C family)
MHRSYFDATPYHLLKHRSHSYYIENGKRTEGRFDADSGITVSNSGLNSPLPDMIKYLNFLIGDASKKEIYDNILKRSSLEEMFQPTIAAPLDANGNAGFTTDIGLIYFLDRQSSETYLGHGGDQNGFISYIEFNPKKRTASILVLTRISFCRTTRRRKKIRSENYEKPCGNCKKASIKNLYNKIMMVIH